jgi:hypothetical protein
MPLLGPWLDRTRKKHATFWGLLFLVILAALVGINFFILPHHAEYLYDRYPGFWALFGMAVAVLMVLVMKKLIYPLITGPEDSYDDE